MREHARRNCREATATARDSEWQTGLSLRPEGLPVPVPDLKPREEARRETVVMRWVMDLPSLSKRQTTRVSPLLRWERATSKPLRSCSVPLPDRGLSPPRHQRRLLTMFSRTGNCPDWTGAAVVTRL